MLKKKPKEQEKEKAPPKQKRKEVLTGVKGMPDILPKEEDRWRAIWQVGLGVSELHDFSYIETPIIEKAEVFEAGIGAATDIVEKQMYTFRTRSGDRVALRPEGTAPVMRSYLEHHLGYFASPFKVFYYGPMFRYEKPQAGRYREFHQWGFEIIADGDPVYDVEIMLVTLDFMKELKFKDVCLKINSIGCRVCRPTYRQKLKDFYNREKNDLCSDCERRLEKNPLRLLDCEEASCVKVKEKAPIILDYLCQNCNLHFRGVLELVEDNNLNYEPNPYLVRGLDYYNRTVFEVYVPNVTSALAGGGRYDYLAELLGGRMIPAVGASIGIERVIETMKAHGIEPRLKNKPKVFFAAVGEQAKKASLKLMTNLRNHGIQVVESLGKESLGSQLKSANKAASPIALIFGQREVFEETIILRDMNSGAQETVRLDTLIEEVKKRLK